MGTDCWYVFCNFFVDALYSINSLSYPEDKYSESIPQLASFRDHELAFVLSYIKLGRHPTIATPPPLSSGSRNICWRRMKIKNGGKQLLPSAFGSFGDVRARSSPSPTKIGGVGNEKKKGWDIVFWIDTVPWVCSPPFLYLYLKMSSVWIGYSAHRDLYTWIRGVSDAEVMNIDYPRSGQALEHARARVQVYSSWLVQEDAFASIFRISRWRCRAKGNAQKNPVFALASLLMKFPADRDSRSF